MKSEEAEALERRLHALNVARCYREVNDLFGDIVKVTPSSKVVGDMALFLFTRGIKPADVVNLEPGSIAFPESVLDMLSGGLGEPMGGFRKDVVRAVLGNTKVKRTRPEPVKLKDTRAKAAANDPLQIGAPIPGMITAMNATVGKAVTKGEKLATL